jgi:hypothetical protein
MKIPINKWTTIEAVQREFRSCFPGLKLEFYSCTQGLRSVYPDGKKPHPQYLIASNNQYDLNSNIIINSSDRVCEIEKMFYDKFGLCAEIFFKGHNRWIQTVKSDHYSLRRLRRELGFSQDFLLL